MAGKKETGHTKKKVGKMVVAERAVTGAKNPQGTSRDRINFAVVTSVANHAYNLGISTNTRWTQILDTDQSWVFRVTKYKHSTSVVQKRSIATPFLWTGKCQNGGEGTLKTRLTFFMIFLVA